MRILTILCISCILGCGATVAENWKRNPETNQMECVQKMKLRGVRDKGAKFEDKSELEDNSFLKDLLPDLELDIDSLTKD